MFSALFLPFRMGRTACVAMLFCSVVVGTQFLVAGDASAQRIPRPVFGMYVSQLTDSNANWPKLQDDKHISGQGMAFYVGAESIFSRYTGGVGFAVDNTASFYNFSLLYEVFFIGGFVRPYGGIGFNYLAYGFENPSYGIAAPALGASLGIEYLINDRSGIDIKLLHNRTSVTVTAYDDSENGVGSAMLQSNSLIQVGYTIRRNIY